MRIEMRKYRGWGKAKSALSSGSKRARQRKGQRQASGGWKDKFVIHEHVMDKDLIVGAGHEVGQNLMERKKKTF